MMLTPWFPASIDPLRPGWYMVKGEFVEGALAMRFWNGKTWLWRHVNTGELCYAAVRENEAWAGLAEEHT